MKKYVSSAGPLGYITRGLYPKIALETLLIQAIFMVRSLRYLLWLFSEKSGPAMLVYQKMAQSAWWYVAPQSGATSTPSASLRSRNTALRCYVWVAKGIFIVRCGCDLKNLVQPLVLRKR